METQREMSGQGFQLLVEKWRKISALHKWGQLFRGERKAPFPVGDVDGRRMSVGSIEGKGSHGRRVVGRVATPAKAGEMRKGDQG